KNILKDSTQVPLEYLPFKSEGKPVSPNTQKLIFDDKNNVKVISMTSKDIKLSINPIQNVPVNPIPEQNIENLIGPTPDYNKYLGPETTARTKNFYVIAPGGNAKAYAQALEYNRYKSAIEWIGKPLPDFERPLIIRVQEDMGQGSGGRTDLVFDPLTRTGKAISMSIYGNRNNLLYSTIPHEVMHTISAEYFGQPLPRFIDEGIAQTTESDIDKKRSADLLINLLQQGRKYDINTLIRMQEYPQDFWPLYAQGHSISEYLIEKGGGGIEGKRKLFEACKYATKHGWENALKKYYGFQNVMDFEKKWLESLGYRIIIILAKILIILTILMITIKKKNNKKIEYLL
ncbi:MAG: hypothetical protein QXW97_04510, partial [Candidatus Pacearchaeota archaeon]